MNFGQLKYFWYWEPENGWPPPSVRDPGDLPSGERINIACTQTHLSSHAQRQLVDRWCELLPTVHGVRYLWFNSRVPQRLFDAACCVPGLEGLYIKWSGIKNIEALCEARSLRHFHLGSSTGVRSIDPLREIKSLQSLGLVNLKQISSLGPISGLRQLECLAVEGSTWSEQHVDTLAPVGELPNLRFLSLIGLRSGDKSLKPLLRLTKLESFQASSCWDDGELLALRMRLQNSGS